MTTYVYTEIPYLNIYIYIHLIYSPYPRSHWDAPGSSVASLCAADGRPAAATGHCQRQHPWLHRAGRAGWCAVEMARFWCTVDRASFSSCLIVVAPEGCNSLNLLAPSRYLCSSFVICSRHILIHFTRAWDLSFALFTSSLTVLAPEACKFALFVSN